MRARARHIVLVGAACLQVTVAGHVALAATNSPRFDPRSDEIDAPITPRLGAEPAAQAPVSGNPLWAIPLSSLRATRERPIFVPSRRPPAPAVAAAPHVEPAKPAPIAVEPDRPALTLVGVVTGTNEGFAVFTDQTTRDIVRLRTGEGHDGWILRSVKGREAVLEKNRKSAVISLPIPQGDQK